MMGEADRKQREDSLQCGVKVWRRGDQMGVGFGWPVAGQKADPHVRVFSLGNVNIVVRAMPGPRPWGELRFLIHDQSPISNSRASLRALLMTWGMFSPT